MGSATAISPNWVLTAGHNLDLDDNGSPDAGLSINFNLPGFGTYTVTVRRNRVAPAGRRVVGRGERTG